MSMFKTSCSLAKFRKFRARFEFAKLNFEKLMLLTHDFTLLKNKKNVMERLRSYFLFSQLKLEINVLFMH